MTIQESFVCPTCGENNVNMLGAGSIMSDVRVDTMSCPKCNTIWRIYSKITENNVEIVRPSDKKDSSEELNSSEE